MDKRRLYEWLFVAFCAGAIGAIYICQPGCKPFEAAWRATGGVKSAAAIADKAIADAALKAHDKCLKKGDAESAEYVSCIKGTRAYDALIKWRSYGRPTINAALIGTVTALQIAERSKEQKLDWQQILKPAACALAKMVDQFSDLFGAQSAVIKLAVSAVKGVSCD